jgi:hypothetical protein
MNWYRNWVERRRGKPATLLIGGICGMVCFWIGYKSFLSPWRAKRRLRESEDYASILLKTKDQN